jgi:hypothetical protein
MIRLGIVGIGFMGLNAAPAASHCKRFAEIVLKRVSPFELKPELALS